MTTTRTSARSAITAVNQADVAKSDENAKRFGHPEWGSRHNVAWNMPRGFEVGVVGVMVALAEYADQHASRYECPIAEDGVIGKEWLNMLRAWKGMLDGETGRLDCVTCCDIYLAVGMAAGFSDKELDS